MDKNAQNAQAFAKLNDIKMNVDYHTQPFLYYLPELLTKTPLSQIDPNQAAAFAQLSTGNKSLPLVKDALLILNRLIHTEEGSLKEPARDIFYGNNSFFWSELGEHTTACDVILHVFNKTIFHLSLGKNL